MASLSERTSSDTTSARAWRTVCAAAALLVMGAAAGPARAQSAASGGGQVERWSDIAVGSEEENYLRVLQVAGLVPLRPWSLRPFAPGELDALAPADSGHPWARRVAGRDSQSVAFRVLSPAAALVYNTGFPYSMNDGAVWAGRGATAVGRGGIFARYRWISLRLEPMAFVAANQNLAIVGNSLDGDARFGDPLEPLYVDAPQRFGDKAYARLDPGQSTLRIDAFGLTIGASTANQYWGPALVDPLILGNNAAGHPNLFIGTSRPLNIGIGTIHARLEAGWLDQSDYTTVPEDSALRHMAGFVAVGTIRGVPGLELGVSRFFHRSAKDQKFGLETFGIPFESWLKEDLPDKDATPDNQLASLFARWVIPPAGLELFGEFARNDHSYDKRDLLLEPDHNSGYMIGARRVSRRRDGRLLAIRVENMSTRVSHLARVRGQSRFYQNTGIRQGHTQLGEVLGSAGGLGGNALTLGVDTYAADGRWTYELARRVRQSNLNEGAPAEQWDVYNVARVERVRFGRRGDLVLGVSGIAELNRDFGDDSYGLRLDLGWRFGARRVTGPAVVPAAANATR